MCVAGGMIADGMREAGAALPGFVEAAMQYSSIWLPLLGLACGTLIGWNAKKRSTSQRMAELENRPTQKQMDDALAEKDARIAKLESPPILKDEQALNFVRSLTDNQHAILREMYENGGTALADPLDGEMLELMSYKMVSRPSEFVYGMVCKWTLPPNVNSIIRRHPEVLGNSFAADETMGNELKRIAALSDEEKSALETLVTMDVQALDLVHDMYVDTFVDTTTSWLNAVDAAGHIRKIAHKSSDQPKDPDEFGKKLHRYRLNEETKRALDKFPEVFDRWRDFHSDLREIASYDKYTD